MFKAVFFASFSIHISTNRQAVHQTPFFHFLFPFEEAPQRVDVCMKLNPFSIKDEIDYFTICVHVEWLCEYLKSLPCPL